MLFAPLAKKARPRAMKRSITTAGITGQSYCMGQFQAFLSGDGMLRINGRSYPPGKLDPGSGHVRPECSSRDQESSLSFALCIDAKDVEAVQCQGTCCRHPEIPRLFRSTVRTARLGSPAWTPGVLPSQATSLAGWDTATLDLRRSDLKTRRSWLFLDSWRSPMQEGWLVFSSPLHWSLEVG